MQCQFRETLLAKVHPLLLMLLSGARPSSGCPVTSIGTIHPRESTMRAVLAPTLCHIRCNVTEVRTIFAGKSTPPGRHLCHIFLNACVFRKRTWPNQISILCVFFQSTHTFLSIHVTLCGGFHCQDKNMSVLQEQEHNVHIAAANARAQLTGC